MTDSQQPIRSFGEIIQRPDADLLKSKREAAHKALDTFITYDHELREAQWEWYIAEYEGKVITEKGVSRPGVITTEQLENVVRRYGRAMSYRFSARFALEQIIGI